MRQRPAAVVLPLLAEAVDSPAAVPVAGPDNVEFRAHSDMDGPLNILRENNIRIILKNSQPFQKLVSI